MNSALMNLFAWSIPTWGASQEDWKGQGTVRGILESYMQSLIAEKMHNADTCRYNCVTIGLTEILVRIQGLQPSDPLRLPVLLGSHSTVLAWNPGECGRMPSKRMLPQCLAPDPQTTLERDF